MAAQNHNYWRQYIVIVFAKDGHESNLNCFVDKMGSNNKVLKWNAMGIF